MSRLLKVFQQSATGAVELGVLQAGEVMVGRDPQADMSLESEAVSFEHGVFVRMRNHWFYRDLGSTNGSWLNDQPLAKHAWKLVRQGDVLQLADVVLRFESADPSAAGRGGVPALGGRTLLVFSKGEFVDEFPVPDYGKALIVGGERPDLELDGDEDPTPALVVEKRGDKLTAYSVGRRSNFFVNGAERSDPTPLSDGDEVAISYYVIFYNDPIQISKGVPLAASPAEGPTAASAAFAAGLGEFGRDPYGREGEPGRQGEPGRHADFGRAADFGRGGDRPERRPVAVPDEPAPSSVFGGRSGERPPPPRLDEDDYRPGRSRGVWGEEDAGPDETLGGAPDDDEHDRGRFGRLGRSINPRHDAEDGEGDFGVRRRFSLATLEGRIVIFSAFLVILSALCLILWLRGG